MVAQNNICIVCRQTLQKRRHYTSKPATRTKRAANALDFKDVACLDNQNYEQYRTKVLLAAKSLDIPPKYPQGPTTWQRLITKAKDCEEIQHVLPEIEKGVHKYQSREQRRQGISKREKNVYHTSFMAFIRSVVLQVWEEKYPGVLLTTEIVRDRNLSRRRRKLRAREGQEISLKIPNLRLPRDPRFIRKLRDLQSMTSRKITRQSLQSLNNDDSKVVTNTSLLTLRPLRQVLNYDEDLVTDDNHVRERFSPSEAAVNLNQIPLFRPRKKSGSRQSRGQGIQLVSCVIPPFKGDRTEYKLYKGGETNNKKSVQKITNSATARRNKRKLSVAAQTRQSRVSQEQLTTKNERDTRAKRYARRQNRASAHNTPSTLKKRLCNDSAPRPLPSLKPLNTTLSSMQSFPKTPPQTPSRSHVLASDRAGRSFSRSNQLLTPECTPVRASSN